MAVGTDEQGARVPPALITSPPPIVLKYLKSFLTHLNDDDITTTSITTTTTTTTITLVHGVFSVYF